MLSYVLSCSMTSKTIVARISCENIRSLSEPIVHDLLLALTPTSFYVDQTELRRCLTWCIDRCIRETYCLPITGAELWKYNQVYLQMKSMLEVQVTAALGFNFFSSMVDPHLHGVIYYDTYMELVINNANLY